MAHVVLRNLKKQVFHGQLSHDIVCRRAQKCFCHKREGRSVNGKVVRQKLPRGFHIFGKSLSEKLPFEMLYLPEVRDALGKTLTVEFKVAPSDDAAKEAKAERKAVKAEVKPDDKSVAKKARS